MAGACGRTQSFAVMPRVTPASCAMSSVPVGLSGIAGVSSVTRRRGGGSQG
jgi:hypothetical protein